MNAEEIIYEIKHEVMGMCRPWVIIKMLERLMEVL